MTTKKEALKKNPTRDERKLKQWVKQGESLAKAKDGNQWAIGDWILAGERTFGKREAYKKALVATGMMRATLYLFKNTAECFPISTRVKNLSFGHHRLVANNDYTPEKRQELLQLAVDNDDTVASFAAHLRSRKKDAALFAETRSCADVAASKVMEACDALLRNYHFETLEDDLPTPAARTKLLERLKKTVADLNSKVEQMVTAWREHEEADEAFLRASSQDDKVMGAGAGN